MGERDHIKKRRRKAVCGVGKESAVGEKFKPREVLGSSLQDQFVRNNWGEGKNARGRWGDWLIIRRW